MKVYEIQEAVYNVEDNNGKYYRVAEGQVKVKHYLFGFPFFLKLRDERTLTEVLKEISFHQRKVH